jgi:hypothetical protein
MSKENEFKKECILIRLEKPKESLLDKIAKIAQGICSVSTALASIFSLFVAKSILNIINEQSQSQVQIQEQTQIVIEPREGDIIVTVGNDYKLLQLINKTDIVFPSKVQEIQYKYSNDEIIDKRVEINNFNNDDWSKQDSFSYIINNFSINPNKVINLIENTGSITVFCDFYSEKNIATYINLGDKNFYFTMINNENKNNFRVSNINEKSEYSYVTNELNNGIEWVKIRVEIEYSINGRTIYDSIDSDWIPTDADMS